MALDADKLRGLLHKPTAERMNGTAQFVGTREVERSGDTLNVTVPEAAVEGTARDWLEAEGLNPDDWSVTGFRRSEWGPGKVSTRFTYKHTPRSTVGISLSDAELATLTDPQTRPVRRSESFTESSTAIVAIADLQFGKMESPAAEVMARVMNAIDDAVFRLLGRPGLDNVIVAFMGDEIEGFVSQGGKNVWRTNLTLTEQIRLTRRVMIYAMQAFHRAGFRVTMLAVPSNHGQAVREPGMTRYDDDHGVESMLAVYDGARLNSVYDDVKFYTPENDEISIALDVDGTKVVFTHGHMVKGGKYHDWVMRQANDSRSLYHGCQLVIMGHWHHLHMEQRGERTVLVVPAGESQSTWYRHLSGTGSSPTGLTLVYTSAGQTNEIEMIRG